MKRGRFRFKKIKEKIKLKDIYKYLIILASIIIVYLVVRELIKNVDTITKISQSAGVLGPIVLIILIGLGILLTPIPSVVLVIAAGYLYGTWWGALYSYLGHLLASIGTFTIFRKINFANQESPRYKKYKALIEKNKKLLYLFYAIPILPLSLVTIISASSKIKWKHFLEIILVSFIPTILFFSYYGNRINSRNLVQIGIWSAIVIILVLVVYKIIRVNQKRMMNGYPPTLKTLKPKKKIKYMKLG